MVTSIGSTNATQAAYAPTTNKNTEQALASTATVAVTEEQASSAPALSAESAASAKLGDQLNAQADASRVQRAVDESTVAAEASEETSEETTDATTGTEAAAARPPAGGAAPAGGASGAASSAETTNTDYIAEADTNSDKTVSDEERAVYEAKLRQQAEESASKPATSAKTDLLDAKTAEVRAAYGQDESTAPALDITA